jgi:hypothetical protein
MCIRPDPHVTVRRDEMLHRGISAVRIMALLLATLCACLTPAFAQNVDFQSSIAFREAFLPPGIPSVAARFDETAQLWNPACGALSPDYYLGYAWEGTYSEDDRQVSTHFLLTKSRGFSMGFMRDDFSKGTKTTTLLSIAPRLWSNFAIGLMGWWKGGFNFNAGSALRLGRHVVVGAVGRNLRDKEDARRSYEGGVAVFGMQRKVICFFDVIYEDNPWRKETTYGGGLTARFPYDVALGVSYFSDGTEHIFRTSLTFMYPTRIVDSEYCRAGDYEIFGFRLAGRSQ